MDPSLLEYLGFSSGLISVLSMIYVFLKRCPLKSKCITDESGNIHLDISLSGDDLQKIKNDEELKKLFLQLKNELSNRKLKQSNNTDTKLVVDNV